MYKNILRLLLGAAGVLLLTMCVAGRWLDEVLGPRFDGPITLFMVLAPIAALVLLCRIKTVQKELKWLAVSVMAALMLFCFLMGVFYWHARTLPSPFALALLLLMILSAGTLLAGAVWTKGFFVSMDPTRAPAHAP